MVVDILFQKNCNQAVPAWEEDVIEHGEPIREKVLSRKSIEDNEIKLCEH